MSICRTLEEVGEKEMVHQLFEKVSKKIKFIKRDDWIEHQICGDFPKVDIRCLVFCCSPSKPCVFRNTILEKMGLTVDDCIETKEEFAQILRSDYDG